MTRQAMQSFLSLNGNELVNAARLKAYVDNGVKPGAYSVRFAGCDGLSSIIPCIGDEPPECGYQLPELDDAPWYDPNVPESKDFAGLLVTSATVSAPYSRVVTPSIGDGQVLGRQKLNGRTIVVTGWLIGRTCCATSYGLSWLASALGDSPCSNGDCGGSDLDFLACCPEVAADDGCYRITTGEGCTPEVYVRPDEESEWQRGSDFWRRFKGAGIVDGPNVLECHGATCGCGCGALIQVEFTLATARPYVYHIADTIVEDFPIPVCAEDACDDCDIVWVVGCTDGGCPKPPDCTDDPNCPFPTLPPVASRSVPSDQCGCISMCTNSITIPVSGEQIWGSSVLNIDVYAGSSPMRNLRIYIMDNPVGVPCVNLIDQDCNACGAILVDYIPAFGTLHFNGETKRITVECNNAVRDAGRNVTDITGSPFSWPELTCSDVCVKLTTDCNHLAADATVSIERVDRDL